MRVKPQWLKRGGAEKYACPPRPGNEKPPERTPERNSEKPTTKENASTRATRPNGLHIRTGAAAQRIKFTRHERTPCRCPKPLNEGEFFAETFQKPGPVASAQREYRPNFLSQKSVASLSPHSPSLAPRGSLRYRFLKVMCHWLKRGKGIVYPLES